MSRIANNGFEFKDHIEFESEKSQKQTPKVRVDLEKKKADLKNMNWEPIGNLILKRKRHQLLGVLNQIKRNYALNTK